MYLQDGVCVAYFLCANRPFSAPIAVTGNTTSTGNEKWTYRQTDYSCSYTINNTLELRGAHCPSGKWGEGPPIRARLGRIPCWDPDVMAPSSHSSSHYDNITTHPDRSRSRPILLPSRPSTFRDKVDVYHPSPVVQYSTCPLPGHHDNVSSEQLESVLGAAHSNINPDVPTATLFPFTRLHKQSSEWGSTHHAPHINAVS